MKGLIPKNIEEKNIIYVCKILMQYIKFQTTTCMETQQTNW